MRQALGSEFKVLQGYRTLFSTAGLNNVGVDPVTMKNQLGPADHPPSGGLGGNLSTTINYNVADLQDAQLCAVDAMEEVLLKPVLGKK